MQVETRTGTWSVRRRWAPRRLGAQTIWARFRERMRKVRRRTTDAGDLPDPGCAGDIVDGIVVFVAFVAVVVFFLFVGLPFLIALGEFVLLVLLGLIGLAGRVLFRRPWTIDAVSPSGDVTTWYVAGWRQSGAARSYIAEQVGRTNHVPSNEEVAAAVVSA